MFHPEPLSLFLSTLALWLCVRTFADPRYAWALGVALGAAQLVRAWALCDRGRGAARAARRPPLARARDRAACSRSRSRRRGTSTSARPTAASRRSRSRRRRTAACPAGASTSASGMPDRDHDALPRAPLQPRGSPSPTTGSGATTSASGPGTRARASPAHASVAERAARRLRAPVASSASCRRSLARRRLGAPRAASSLRRPQALAVALAAAARDRRLPLLRRRATGRPDGDLLKATLHAHDGRRLGARVRLCARPPARPLVAGRARAARASARSSSSRSSSTDGGRCGEHVLEEAVEPGPRLPAELGLDPARVGGDRLRVGRPDERRVDDDRGLARVRRTRADQSSGSSPSSCHSSSKPGERERAVGELPDVVQLPRAEDVVAVGARLVGHAADRRLAEDRDHPVDVVRREAPVALRLQVAERERRRRRAGPQRVHVVDDLPREELRRRGGATRG